MRVFLGSVDFVAEVLGGGLVGGAAAGGVVLQHDLHGVALAAADGGGIEAGVYQFGAGPLAQREDGGVELAGADAQGLAQLSTGLARTLWWRLPHLQAPLISARALFMRLSDIPARRIRPNALSSAAPSILEYGRLRVLAPPNSYLFVMKLLAYRQQDQADMRLLWPSCGFSSVEDAVELYWECYPGALADPFLGEAVGEIISPNNSVEDTGP